MNNSRDKLLKFKSLEDLEKAKINAERKGFFTQEDIKLAKRKAEILMDKLKDLIIK